LEIYDKQKEKYYEVWMSNEEQLTLDRNVLARQLLSKKAGEEYKVVFFLSGEEDLYRNTEGLLLMNLGCA